MAHVVTSKCQNCKFTDCVEVCPVACFYEMDTQLVIAIVKKKDPLPTAAQRKAELGY